MLGRVRGNVGGETIENTGIIDQMWQDDAMTFVRKFARTEDEGGREGKERREGNEGQGDREDREGVPCCGLDSDRVYRFLRITAGLSPLPPVLGAKAGKGRPSQMNGDRSLLRGDSYDDNDPYHMKRAALKGKYKDLYRNDTAADDAEEEASSGPRLSRRTLFPTLRKRTSSSLSSSSSRWAAEKK